MHAYLNEYPPAPPGMVAAAEEMFPYQTITPEVYAAKEGHRWLCFSFDNYIYPNAVLNEWLHSLGDILFGGKLAEMQKKFLTPQELEQVMQESSKEF
jgi:hypothetical protein